MRYRGSIYSSLILFHIFVILLANQSPIASGFETQGAKGPDSFDLGLPVHQDITREGLYFLKPDSLEAIVSQHIKIEQYPASPNHFDNCQFAETVARINERYSAAIVDLNPKHANLPQAQENFGYILHAAQDFYSHTNWVEMGRTDLIDPWYGNWKSLNGYTTSSNSNPVFILEEDGKPHSNFQIRANGKIMTVSNPTWNFTGMMGLISGTYDADVSKCPPTASIPHGGATSTITDRLYPDESRDLADELNKDNPARQGHWIARVLAVQQTTHEFCRLVDMERSAYGDDGVRFINDNWVQEQYLIDSPANNSRCPSPDSSHTGLISDSASGEKSVVAIPSWVKNNARYWSDGSISDKEFATGIGYMVQQKIISANVATNPDGTILVNDNLSIPKWIKNNAKYWSEGSISDSDFTSGIEFMVNQSIISFSEPADKYGGISNNDLKSLYATSKQYENIAQSLLILTDSQENVLQGLTASGWNKNTDSKTATHAQVLDLLIQKQETDKQSIQQAYDLAYDVSHKIKDLATKQGVSSSDLDKIASMPQKYGNSAGTPISVLKQSADDVKNKVNAAQNIPPLSDDEKNKVAHALANVLGAQSTILEQFRAGVFAYGHVAEIQSLLDNNRKDLTDNEVAQLQHLLERDAERNTPDPAEEERNKQHVLDLMQQAIDLLQKEKQDETDSILNYVADPSLKDLFANQGPPTAQTSTVPQTSPLTETLLGFNVPSHVVQEATSGSGAIVHFTTSFSSPGSGSNQIIACSPPDGTVFPLGDTVVTCTETDLPSSKTLKKSFTVTVQDTTPPLISPFAPHNDTPDDSGAIVYFTMEAIDLVDGSVTPHCDHTSGSKFPIGTTIVTCTADDSRGNHGSRSFQISITKS
jgi:hypothetical protein